MRVHNVLNFCLIELRKKELIKLAMSGAVAQICFAFYTHFKTRK